MNIIKVSFYLLLFFTISICQEVKKKNGISTSGSMGSVTIDGKIYNQIALRPEIPIGKLGIGLDFYLYFNDEGIYKDGWNFSSFSSSYETIIDKIYYVKWGKPADNLYFKAGALPSATLGEGILVNNYSNIMQYPEIRQIGLDYKMKFFKNFGIEFIHSNFKQSSPGVIAGRLFYTPVSRLEFGFSYAIDANQFAALKDSDEDNVPDVLDDFPEDALYQLDSDGDGLADTDPLETDVDNDGVDTFYWDKDSLDFITYEQEKLDALTLVYADRGILDNDGVDSLKSRFNLDENISSISGMAFDMTFKLTRNMGIYGQYAKLNTDEFMLSDSTVSSGGWGFSFPGFFLKLGPVKFRAEYRQSGDYFMFNYWDQAYDLTRVTVSGDIISTKSEQLKKYTGLKGVYGDISANFLDMVWFNIAYQNLVGSNEQAIDNGTLMGTLKINTRKIPKVNMAEAFYQQSNVENPFAFNFTESSIAGYNLGFEVSEDMTLIYKNRTTYEKDASGKIIPISSMQIETQLKF